MKRSVVGLGCALALAGMLSLAPNLTFGQDPGNGTDVAASEVDEVQVSAETTEAAPGDSVEVTAAVLDANGAPLAGVECTFSVASQPGTDASVEAGPVTTDAEGNATTTLDVGSSEGTVVVEADCEGVTATVSVVAAAAAPPGALPGTGTGTGTGTSTGGPQLLAILMVAALTATIVGAGTLAVARGRGARTE